MIEVISKTLEVGEDDNRWFVRSVIDGYYLTVSIPGDVLEENIQTWLDDRYNWLSELAISKNIPETEIQNKIDIFRNYQSIIDDLNTIENAQEPNQQQIEWAIKRLASILLIVIRIFIRKVFDGGI